MISSVTVLVIKNQLKKVHKDKSTTRLSIIIYLTNKIQKKMQKFKNSKYLEYKKKMKYIYKKILMKINNDLLTKLGYNHQEISTAEDCYKKFHHKS